jgi:hypothetical protein
MLAFVLSCASPPPSPSAEADSVPVADTTDSSSDTDPPGSVDTDSSDPKSQRFSGTYGLEDADALVLAPGHDTYAANVLAAGDVTGDGTTDLLVANVLGGNTHGGVYVVPSAPDGEVGLDDLAYEIASGALTRGAGRSLGVGDVDGDGFQDVGVGAPWVDEGRDGQFVLYGPLSGDVDLPTDHDAALTCGAPSNFCGHGSDLGDVNGDAVADAVSSANQDDTMADGAGKLFVEFGPITGDVDLDSEADVEIFGVRPRSFPGKIVKAGADFDGDGIGDLVASASYDDTGGPFAGAAYVVFGPMEIATLADATMLVGHQANAFAAETIAAGDVDGDGFADVAASYDLPSPGGTYVARGPFPGSTVDLALSEIVIEATTPTETFGVGLGFGDVDADGDDELLIGDPKRDSEAQWAGMTYLVSDPADGTWNIGDLALANFVGTTASELSGWSEAIADIDDDGFGDLLIGATGAGWSGGAYVWYD